MTLFRKLLIVCFCGGIAACSSPRQTYETSAPPNPAYKIGKPYRVAGKIYRPAADPYYDKIGMASWYGHKFNGRKTANGDIFNMNELTAAHPTLPMPSYVRVTNVENGRWLILKINDRGPFVGNRLIDVSRRAAQLLGFEKKGVTKVRVQAVNGPRGELPRQTRAQIVPQKMPSLHSSNSVEVTQSENIPQISQTAPENASTSHPKNNAGKKIYVQVGAFADQKNAEKLSRSVQEFSDIKIDKVDINGQNLYRVRIGPHPTEEIAEIILGRILALGHNTAHIIMDY